MQANNKVLHHHDVLSREPGVTRILLAVMFNYSFYAKYCLQFILKQMNGYIPRWVQKWRTWNASAGSGLRCPSTEASTLNNAWTEPLMSRVPVLLEWVCPHLWGINAAFRVVFSIDGAPIHMYTEATWRQQAWRKEPDWTTQEKHCQSFCTHARSSTVMPL